MRHPPIPTLFPYTTLFRSLREFLPHGKATDKPVGVILEPHANSEFTQQFTVAKQEYDMWSKGAQPHLGLRMQVRSEEHTSELQSHSDLVCRLLLEKKKTRK